LTTNSTGKKSTGGVCQTLKANELVSGRCQGQKQCRLTATFDDFGWIDCARSIPDIHQNPFLHLKVVYNCVPKEVLRESLVSNRPIRPNPTDRSMPVRPLTSSIVNNNQKSIDSTENKSISNQSNNSHLLMTSYVKEQIDLNSSLVTLATITTNATTTTSTSQDYSEFVDAPHYDLNKIQIADTKKKKQLETAANYKTHLADHAEQIKSPENEIVWSDFASIYRHFESTSLCLLCDFQNS
jgi:hypothetical protein